MLMSNQKSERRKISWDALENIIQKLRIVSSEEDKQSLLRKMTAIEKTVVISFFNAHAVLLSLRDPNFASHLQQADMLLRDGVGVSYLLRLCGRKLA